jgi:hypothetical protein
VLSAERANCSNCAAENESDAHKKGAKEMINKRRDNMLA